MNLPVKAKTIVLVTIASALLMMGCAYVVIHSQRVNSATNCRAIEKLKAAVSTQIRASNKSRPTVKFYIDNPDELKRADRVSDGFLKAFGPQPCQ